MLAKNSFQFFNEDRYLWAVGQIWIDAQRHILKYGKIVNSEIIETLNYSFSVKAEKKDDSILQKWAKLENIKEMRKVFHTSLPNKFGHNYHKKMIGPITGDPIDSITKILSKDSTTKRAVITMIGSSKGDVPCLNVIQFLIREENLYVNYFARGQDIFNKFYADVICVLDIAEEVKNRLNKTEIYVSGTIGSAHIYLENIADSESLIKEADNLIEHGVISQ